MKKNYTDKDDSDIFRQAMGKVKPIRGSNRVLLKPPPRRVVHQPELPQSTDNGDFFSDAPINEDCPDILSFARSGLQHSILKRLRQGKMPVENSLDLHGLTVQQARTALIHFLRDCDNMAYRHVIIIHGKGYRSKTKPVIKPMLNRWLRLAPGVLAFHSALPEDGGSGALYVMLRKSTLTPDRHNE